MIQEKTNELGRFLNGRSVKLDFSEPVAVLERTDSRAVREAILNLTQAEARKRGIGKTTLHYLKKRARTTRPLRTYASVLGRLLN